MNIDINELVIKWQAEAQNQLRKIINEIVEHSDQIKGNELNIANIILLFTNITLYAKRCNVDISLLGIIGLP